MIGRADRLFLVLAAGVVAAAAGLVSLVLRPAALPAPFSAQVAQGPGMEAPPPRAPAPFDAYRPVFERPLFNRDRRPDPPPAPPVPPEPAIVLPVAVAEPPALLDLEGLELVGMALSAEGHVALVRRPGETAVTRLHRGDVFGRWRVETVEQGAVLFTLGEQSHILAFRKIR